MREAVRRVLKGIERVEMFLAKLFLAAMIGVVGAQVVFRYGFNRPLSWPEELSGFLLIWLTFLVADILVKRRTHVQVDYFADRLPAGVRPYVTLTVNLLVMAFLVFLVVSSITIETVQIHHGVGAALRIPKAFYTLAATVSSVSMLLSIAFQQWEILAGLSRRSVGDSA